MNCISVLLWNTVLHCNQLETAQNTGLLKVTVELAKMSILRWGAHHFPMFVSWVRGSDFLSCSTMKPIWQWRAPTALVSQFCGLFYSQEEKKKNHPSPKFSKWGLFPFHWKQIGSLLPGRAQLGPVTWEWLGEHAFCPLFFQSGNTFFPCKK